VNYQKVVKSAVVIIPPEELWGPIQEIRKVHDKAYKRWMPHINLLYPFVSGEYFPEVVEQLRQGISSLSPFKLTFNKFNYFPHGTVWLLPETKNKEANTLQNLLEKTFPFCKDLSDKSGEGFTPHLSVGQWPKKDLKSAVESLQKKWSGIEFTVSEVYMISREGFDDPFKVIFKVPLANGAIEQVSNVPKKILQSSTSSNNNKVFVGNLPFSAVENDIQEVFKKHDLNPLQITIVRNPGGQPKGFGFVEFSSEEEVAHAIQKVNLAILHGREIKVQPSK